MKILYLMRHGETLFNLRRKMQGWCDSPLTERGKKQALKAKKYFDDHHITFDHAYSSPSERACDTIELITDMPYTRVKGLKEWNFGIFEGESQDLIPPIPYGNYFQPFGGEGQWEMQQRVSDTLTEIMNREGHETVLAVSHGAAARGLVRQWEKNGRVSVDRPLSNCCILKFGFENNEFILLEKIEHDFSDISEQK